MDLRQAWHKYNKFLRALPPCEGAKANSMAILWQQGRVLHGVFHEANANDKVNTNEFEERNFTFEHQEAAWEIFQHRYAVKSLSAIDREGLLKAVEKVAAVPQGRVGASRPSYMWQIQSLRKVLTADSHHKEKGTHLW